MDADDGLAVVQHMTSNSDSLATIVIGDTENLGYGLALVANLERVRGVNE